MIRKYFHCKLSSSLDKIFDFSRDEPVRSLSVDPTPDCRYLNLDVPICLQERWFANFSLLSVVTNTMKGA